LKAFIKNHIYFISIVLVALCIRIFLALYLLQPGFSVNDDLLRYQDWGKIAYDHQVSDTYSSKYLTYGTNPNNQPPGTVYIDLSMYSLSQIVHFFSPQQPDIYPFFLKLPNILADLLIGIMIYYLINKKNKKKYALFGSCLFLLNPVVIYNSAVWGQTDALNNVLFFASLVLLFSNKYFFSILLFFFSLYIKLSLLPLFPLYLLILLKKTQFNLLRSCIYVIVSMAILLLFTLPLSSTPHIWLTQFFIHNSSGELQHIVNYSFNFWSVLFNPDSFSLIPLSSDIYFGLSLATWAYILFTLTYIPLLIYTLKQKRLSDSQVLALLFIAAFATFLLLPRMHQRYIYPVIPLIATYIGIERKNIIPYILLSIVNFINLYVVWHPSDFLPVFFTNIIAHSKIRLGMSVLTVLLFIVMYIRTLQIKPLKRWSYLPSRNS